MENGPKNQYCTHPTHYFYMLSRIWLRKVKKFTLIEPVHFCTSTLSSTRFHVFKIFCQKCSVKLMLDTSYWGFSSSKNKAYLEPSRTSKMELFCENNSF